MLCGNYVDLLVTIEDARANDVSGTIYVLVLRLTHMCNMIERECILMNGHLGGGVCVMLFVEEVVVVRSYAIFWEHC